MKLLLCVTFSLLVWICYSHPTGAPKSACKDLLPVHRENDTNGEKIDKIIKPQQSSSPFAVSIVPANIKPGDTVSVTISGAPFQGFMIRAYDEKGNPIDGKFLEEANLQTLECDAPDDTATHTSKDPKENFTLQWKSPDNLKEKVKFHLTIAKDYWTFWKMESGAVTVS